VLEEAFARNPRPNKDERQEIINKVALGDKEVQVCEPLRRVDLHEDHITLSKNRVVHHNNHDVFRESHANKSCQIWFQNHRQSSRRKTKPLETNEVEAHLELKSSSPMPPERNNTPENTLDETVELKNRVEVEALENNKTEKSWNKEELPEQHEEIKTTEFLEQAGKTRDNKTAVDSQETVAITSIMSSQGLPPSTFPTELGSSQGLPTSSQDTLFSTIGTKNYIANRRSASFVRQQPEQPSIAMAQANRAPGMRKSGSYLRLSMTEGGQARVIDRSVPSPPRSQPLATSPTTEQALVGGLRRSYSAAGLNDLFKQSASQETARMKVPRVSTAGRSRDSRAWEFWCDSEARNSLANKAAQENSGSAADAIGLIRQSSRNALRPNSRKANSPMVGQGSLTAINRGRPAKPKLQRASTTYGRLQQGQTKKCSEEYFDCSPGSDSDKENWDPEESQANAVSRRFLSIAANPRRGRTILGENVHIPSYNTSLGGFMDSEKKHRGSPAVVDAEVASFMGTGGENDDLDCVQSLLSLSKGNWR
jgi:hypothetical protein